MANIRVTCPTCNAELEIGEEHLGQEVECGSCLGAFVAEDPKSKKRPYKMQRPKDDDEDEDDRPRKKRRRRRDEDDDYDYSPPGSRDGGGGSGLAIASLILGIISIPMACCCGLFSIPLSLGAIATGGMSMKNPEGKGMAVTGVVLGVISLGLCVAAFAIGFGANMAQFNQIKR